MRPALLTLVALAAGCGSTKTLTEDGYADCDYDYDAIDVDDGRLIERGTGSYDDKGFLIVEEIDEGGDGRLDYTSRAEWIDGVTYHRVDEHEMRSANPWTWNETVEYDPGLEVVRHRTVDIGTPEDFDIWTWEYRSDGKPAVLEIDLGGDGDNDRVTTWTFDGDQPIREEVTGDRPSVGLADWSADGLEAIWSFEGMVPELGDEATWTRIERYDRDGNQTYFSVAYRGVQGFDQEQTTTWTPSGEVATQESIGPGGRVLIEWSYARGRHTEALISNGSTPATSLRWVYTCP